MSAPLNPKSASMRLWHALLAHGVSQDEATDLMNGYAHELADRVHSGVDEFNQPPQACNCGSPQGDDEDAAYARRYWKHSRSCPQG